MECAGKSAREGRAIRASTERENNLAAVEAAALLAEDALARQMEEELATCAHKQCKHIRALSERDVHSCNWNTSAEDQRASRYDQCGLTDHERGVLILKYCLDYACNSYQ